jgi:hypothetical protein
MDKSSKKARTSKRTLKMKNYVLNNENLQFEEKSISKKLESNDSSTKVKSKKDLLKSEEFNEKSIPKKEPEESFVRPTKLLSDLGNRTNTIKEVAEDYEIEEIKEVKHENENDKIEEVKEKSEFKTSNSEMKIPKIAKLNPFLQKPDNNDSQDFKLEVESSKQSLSSKAEGIKTVAILGACGFLGYKVTKLMLEKGYNVVMGIPEDNSSDDKELIRIIKEQYGDEKIEVFEFDFFDSKKSDELLRGCQALVHCARVRRKYT